MSRRRVFGNYVILPTGDIVAFGGTDNGGVQHSTPELLSQGGWSDMTPHEGPRDYHSGALLLPDGRVFIAGGEARTFDYQIWQPPYFHLDWGGDRPLNVSIAVDINGVPGPVVSQTALAGMAYNGEFRATWSNPLPAGVGVDRVVFMKPASLTHHDDGAQLCLRVISWHDEDGTGTPNSIRFRSPASTQVAPPGWYMVFLVTTSGVPSIAYWVNLK